ncbi:MAG: cell division protein FtsW [Lachnospiraceae bacterium]|nr:cell division protein FtsW [Lachnospiraceae bacterium]
MENTVTLTKSKRKKYFDFTLLFIVLFLLGFGLVMVYSTSSYVASVSSGDDFAFFKQQLRSIIVGLFVMFAAYLFPYKFYKKFAPFILLMAFIIVPLVLTPLGGDMGETINGARRWIFLFGFSVQPAELVKIAVIIYTAALLSKMTMKERQSFRGTAFILGPAGILFLMLLFITTNLSSAIIVFGIAYVLLVIASKKNIYAYMLLIGAAILGVLGIIMIAQGIGSSIWGFRGERILAWLNPEAYADGKGFQVLQSLYSIGSGGIFGKGLGKSMQKLGFLPYAQNDMIFAIICEELGLFGGLAVIFMFVLLLFRLRDIVYYTTDLFGSLLVCGVFAHIAIQVVLNVAVVTNTIPNTGISLPFISYGGSSVIFLLAEIGIVMNVASNIDFATPNVNYQETIDEEN